MASGSLCLGRFAFVDWEERYVSHDRGSRVVHYFLRDRYGHQCLAVIGTERSLRHMVYVVSDEFLDIAGLDKSTTSACKWRARREVVDWLSSLLVKNRSSSESHHSSGSPSTASTSSDLDRYLHEDHVEGHASVREESRIRHNNDHGVKHFSASKADVIWIGSPWLCRKRLQHYHGFQRNGITISVQDFVYVMTEERERHIAYVEDLYEDRKLRKKLKVRWFHKISELGCRIPPPAPQPHEVFYTTFEQDLSVECVDGLATVLSSDHYNACLGRLSGDFMAQMHMCSREFDSLHIKPFNIQGVKGYWQQPVLSAVGLAVTHDISSPDDHGSEDVELDEEEETEPGRPVCRGPRTARSAKRRGCFLNRILGGGSVDSDAAYLSEGGGSGSLPSGQIKYKQLSFGGGRSEERAQESGRVQFDLGDNVEMLCEDSGIRGCWFRGTVIRRGCQRLKVRHKDVLNEDEKGYLEEWVQISRVALCCKLNIRATGRTTLRPSPDIISRSDWEVGSAVDVWWNDGWWEGIILKQKMGGVHVYLLGEKECHVFQPNDLRVSREWVNGHWIDIPRQLNVEWGTNEPRGNVVLTEQGSDELLVAALTELQTSPRSPQKQTSEFLMEQQIAGQPHPTSAGVKQRATGREKNLSPSVGGIRDVVQDDIKMDTQLPSTFTSDLHATAAKHKSCAKHLPVSEIPLWCRKDILKHKNQSLCAELVPVLEEGSIAMQCTNTERSNTPLCEVHHLNTHWRNLGDGVGNAMVLDLRTTADFSREVGTSDSGEGILLPVKLESKEHESTSEVNGAKEVDFRKTASAGLKWKTGRKRHRQGEGLSNRSRGSQVQAVKDEPRDSMDSIREDTSSDSYYEAPVLREDIENLPGWKPGSDEKTVKSKKHKQGNEENLKARHGPAIRNSLFSSMHVANLVMSR